MFPSLPKSAWLVLCFFGILFGGVLGIASAQNALVTGIPLIAGVFLVPWTVAAPLQVDTVSHVPLWLLWVVYHYYLLVILLTALCGYWTQVRIGMRWRSWRPFGLLVSVSIGMAFLTTFFAPSLNSNGTVFAGSIVFLSWAQLSISAGLGWGIACLFLRPKQRKEGTQT